LEVEDRLEADDAHGERIGDADVEEGVLELEAQRADGGVGAAALVDGALGGEAEAEPVPGPEQADARVLQREAVVAADELDVGVVLGEAALQAQDAVELVAEAADAARGRSDRRRLGRRRDLDDVVLLGGGEGGDDEEDEGGDMSAGHARIITSAG